MFVFSAHLQRFRIWARKKYLRYAGIPRGEQAVSFYR